MRVGFPTESGGGRASTVGKPHLTSWTQQPDAEPGALHWVAVDARMDEAHAAAYRSAPAGWAVVVVPPALYTLPALAEAWSRHPPARVVGNALTVFAGRLPDTGAWAYRSWPTGAAALGRLALQAYRTPS